MIKLIDKETEQSVGQITEEQFAFLQDLLEEESEQDDDYYFTADTIDMLEEDGADAELV